MKYLLLYSDIYLSIEPREPSATSDFIIVAESDCAAVTIDTVAVGNNSNIIVSLPVQTTINKASFQWYPSDRFCYTVISTDISCDTFATSNLTSAAFKNNWTDQTDYLQQTANVPNTIPSILYDNVYRNTFTLAMTYASSPSSTYYGISRIRLNVVYQFEDSDSSIDTIHALYPNNTAVVSNDYQPTNEEWLIDGDAPTYTEALPYQNVFTLRPYTSPSLYIGDDPVTAVYRGDREITTIYMGNTEL